MLRDCQFLSLTAKAQNQVHQSEKSTELFSYPFLFGIKFASTTLVLALVMTLELSQPASLILSLISKVQVEA